MLSGLAAFAVVSAVALGSFAFSRKFGGSAALEELERANKVLAGRVTELTADNKMLAAKVAALERERNIALALVPVLDAMTQHEERANSRHEATLHVLDLIADRLGPDPNGGVS